MTVESAPGPPRALYLHLPFCTRRCPYCDFAIAVGDDGLQQRYLTALLRELDWIAASGAARAPLETVYLGGGTPSLLGPERMGRLLDAVRRSFAVAPDAEVTIEANPEQVDPGVVRDWHRLGVTRVSLGVQSLDDQALSWLGRVHDAGVAERAVAVLRESPIPALSCDLIYALPVQSTATFASGLERLLGHRPDHVSCYELTVEPGTRLHRLVNRGTEPGPREADSVEQGRLALEMLGGAGLRRYEVSNYSLPGAESRHNLNYWTGGAYLAAGCGAHGFLDPGSARALGFEGAGAALRYWHLRAAATYQRSVQASGRGLRGHEWLSDSQLALERLALRLRLSVGVELGHPRQLARAHELAEQGWLVVEGSRVRATALGAEILDRITLELAAA